MRRKDTRKAADNVLMELGFEDAAELSATSFLAIKLHELIQRRGLSQFEAPTITGTSQPIIPEFGRHHLAKRPVERPLLTPR